MNKTLIHNRIEKWKAFIPQHITNRKMLLFYRIAAFFSLIPKAKIVRHVEQNQMLFKEKGSPFKAGDYIENQAEWGAIKFGISRHSSMAYSGCEIMATYNAKLALGEMISEKTMVDLIARYERKGVALNGAIGTSPKEIITYFQENGYKVIMTESTAPKLINQIGRTSDTIIVTAYNNRNDITGMIHTVSVTKEENGTYTLHNAYVYRQDSHSYVAKGGYHTLQEAIENMSSAPAVICVIGICRRVDAELK